MSKVIRSVKNVTKGYSAAQVKVRDGGSFRSLSLSLCRYCFSPSPTPTALSTSCGDAMDVLGIVRFKPACWPTVTHHHCRFGDMT